MGESYRTESQADFSGGVNAVTSPYLVTKKQVVVARNMLLDDHGALRTRDGYRVETTSPNTTDPIVFRGLLTKSDGSQTPFAIQKTSTGNKLYTTAAEPWTLVGTMPVAYDTPDVVIIGNLAFIANGYETPWVWDGTTLSRVTISDPATQTVPSGAKHAAAHLGAVWIWNTAPSSSTLDGPASLRASFGNLLPASETTAADISVFDWPDDFQVHVARDDGQQGMGMSTFTIAETGISPTATMVLFKNFSAYQVAGFFGSVNFSIQRVKSDMGCVAPRSIQFSSGYGIIRLTHRGFALYNGVEDRLLSEEIRPYLFGRRDITPIEWGSAAVSWSTQAQNPPLYLCACPVDGPDLSRIFVFDLVRRAWTVCDFNVSLATLAVFAGSVYRPVVQAGTFTGGKILTLFDGAQDDAGVDIPWQIRTRDVFVGSPMRPTYWRRVVLDMDFTSPQSVATVSTIFSLGARAATATFTGTVSGDTYGSSLYGTAIYASSSINRAHRSIDLQRTAPSMRLDLTGTGPVTLRGVEWQAKPKPVTRMAR